MTTTIPALVHQPDCRAHEYQDNDMCDCEPGTYVFSKYTLRNERYTFGSGTQVQGDFAYGMLNDVFEILDNVSDKVTGKVILHRAWDVYETAEGKRFAVETYHEEA
jgi:hypothetical protein